MKRRCSTQLFICALAGALVFAVILSMSSGQYDIPMETVIASFAHAADLPILPNVAPTPEQEAVLWHIRLPRTLVGMMVGAGLGISGAVLQGIFSNPLADVCLCGIHFSGESHRVVVNAAWPNSRYDTAALGRRGGDVSCGVHCSNPYRDE